MVRGAVATEIVATSPSRRAWIIVFPSAKDMDDFEFRIEKFEIDQESMDYLKQNLEISKKELINLETVHVSSIESIENELAKRGVSSDLFDAPWRVDYPLPLYGP